VSQYKKGKTNLDFTDARDSEWQWHQLCHMQVCTSLQTDNHTSTPLLSFLQARCPSCRPTNSVKALKAKSTLSCKSVLKQQLKISPHLKRTTTLPGNISPITVTHLSLSRCTYCVSGAKRKFSDTQHSTCATKAHLYDCSLSQCCDSVHTALILRSRLYQTVQCPSVRPSVCPRMGHSTKLCCHWPSGRKYQLTAGQHSAANASSVMLRPKVQGSTQTY